MMRAPRHLRGQQWLQQIHRPLGWLRQQEPVVLLVMLLVVLGMWAFLALASEVLEGTTQQFDVWIVSALRRPHQPALPRGPQWVAEIARDITALGSQGILVLLVVAVAGFLRLQRQYKTMWFVLGACWSGFMLSTLLKVYFARPRPDFVPYVATMTQSFPSGHSMLSAVVYLSLGALLAQRQHSRKIKAYFLSVALWVTFLVGLSRVYLGVHYPTDVLAGWTIGLVWALLWWLLARRSRTAQDRQRS